VSIFKGIVGLTYVGLAFYAIWLLATGSSFGLLEAAVSMIILSTSVSIVNSYGQNNN
jgi:hypothetical protein